jgi:DNA polymerase III delta subunit
MKFRELKNHLQTRPLFPAYIATGDDAFVIGSAVKLFKAAVSGPPDFNISSFDDAAGADGIIAALDSMPLAADFRLVVARDYRGDCAPLAEYLKKPNQQAVLLFVAAVLKDNFAAILPRLTPIDCGRLDESDLLKFIAKNAAEYGAEVSPDAARLLIRYCNFNLSRISSELEKLAFMRLGGTVTAADAENFVAPESDYKIYEISDAVARKQNGRAALVLKSLLDANIQPGQIMGMLYSHFRRLLYCAVTERGGDLAGLLGVKEYAVTKLCEQCRDYSPVRLKRICDAFHDADYSFKSGLISDITALEVCIMRILGGG